MVDTKWLPVADVVELTGLSRQGVNNAARQVLRQVDLSRKGDNNRWLIEPSAVEHYVEHGSWPRGIVQAVRPVRSGPSIANGELERTIDDLRGSVESAELRMAFAAAAEHAAVLAERDARIEMLERERDQALEAVAAVKEEFKAVLLARLEALD